MSINTIYLGFYIRFEMFDVGILERNVTGKELTERGEVGYTVTRGPRRWYDDFLQ